MKLIVEPGLSSAKKLQDMYEICAKNGKIWTKHFKNVVKK